MGNEGDDMNGNDMNGNDGSDVRTAFRTCPLCEAGCGLEITVKRGPQGETVTRIRGDMADVFSHGYICPKGSTLKQLHDDPDRVRRPLVKRNGVHEEVEWAEAWAVIADRLPEMMARHGRESVGVYLGNPSAHSLSALLYNRSMLQALGTRRRFSASTVDQMPRQVAAAYVFGTAVSVPVPDLDHTDFLVIMGANPYASNGSLCTAPDFPGRIEAIRARGGTVVVVDPRRSRTAEEADRWLPIRPGTDALLLATGLAAGEIRSLARDMAAAASGSVYGRIGTTTTGLGNEGFGTVTSWLIDVVNIVTGNLDRRGGAMFTMPVAGAPTTRGKSGTGKGFAIGRGHTVSRQLPEVMGEYPAAAMAEEITRAGDQGIKVMITVAGNPVLSTPNSLQLDEALSELEFMVSVDMYLNETTRHADVILPPPSQLQRGHYDVALLQFAIRNVELLKDVIRENTPLIGLEPSCILSIRNVANYSDPVLPLDDHQPDEWEILAKLGLIAAGLGADAEPALADEVGMRSMVQSSVNDPNSPIHGRDADEIVSALGDEPGPARMLDFMLQTGPFGAAFGANPDGASVALLRANPHGVDFGALQARLPEILRTPSGTIELNHPILMADLVRLHAAMDAAAHQPLVLVGRRHLRSNNSWMHNIEVLVKGKPRCTLHVHPDDAARLGLSDGGVARVTSRVGTVDAAVEVTDSIRPGVVSLPHGWGHGQPGTRMRVAAERAGVNSNILADHTAIDPLSGTSVLNGIPVEIVGVAVAAV